MLLKYTREESDLDHGGDSRKVGMKCVISGYILKVKSTGFDSRLFVRLVRKRPIKDDTKTSSLRSKSGIVFK